MGTLGKILLGINLLAAAGVAYFASQDYAKRQEVTGMALKYHLTLSGLPVEAPTEAPTDSSVPLQTELPDGMPVQSVRPQLLMNYFAGAEGGTQFPAKVKLNDLSKLDSDKVKEARELNIEIVKENMSQIGEVERVEKQLKAQLDAMPPATQLTTLCGPVNAASKVPSLLVGMAETWDEREFLRALWIAAQLDTSKTATNLAVAREILTRKFAAVKAKPNPEAAATEAATLKEAAENVRAAGAKAKKAYEDYEAAYKTTPNDPATTKLEDDAIELRKKLIKADADLKEALAKFGTATSRDAGDRKKRIAHLLMHLDASAPWQKRVALVVGLRTYSTVLGEQVNRLKDMAMRAQDQKVHDQARFSDEYELIKTLAVQQSLLLDRQIAITADYRDQWAKDRDALKKRHGQLLQREEALVSIRAQVNDALAKQSAAETDLFTVQKAVGETLRNNFELEDKLDATEQKTGKK